MLEASTIAVEGICASWHENSVDFSLSTVKVEHFNKALEKISPSVSEEVHAFYTHHINNRSYFVHFHFHRICLFFGAANTVLREFVEKLQIWMA